MNTFTTSLLVTLALITGCAASTEEVDTTEQAVGAAIVQTNPSATALASKRANVVLSGESASVVYLYDEDITPVDATVRQVIDVTNTGDAHVFGVYTSAGRKVGSLNLPARETSSFQILRAGDYELTCEDCQGFSAEADTAKDWAEFVTIFNAGRAFTPVRPSVTVHVRASR